MKKQGPVLNDGVRVEEYYGVAKNTWRERERELVRK